MSRLLLVMMGAIAGFLALSRFQAPDDVGWGQLGGVEGGIAPCVCETIRDVSAALEASVPMAATGEVVVAEDGPAVDPGAPRAARDATQDGVIPEPGFIPVAAEDRALPALAGGKKNVLLPAGSGDAQMKRLLELASRLAVQR